MKATVIGTVTTVLDALYNAGLSNWDTKDIEQVTDNGVGIGEIIVDFTKQITKTQINRFVKEHDKIWED